MKLPARWILALATMTTATVAVATFTLIAAWPALAAERGLNGGAPGTGDPSPPAGAASAATALRSDGTGELASPRIAAEAAPTVGGSARIGR